MLVKDWTMEHSSEASHKLTQLKGQGAIPSAGLGHISFQEGQRSAVFSAQLISGCYLSAKCKSAETNID